MALNHHTLGDAPGTPPLSGAAQILESAFEYTALGAKCCEHVVESCGRNVVSPCGCEVVKKDVSKNLLPNMRLRDMVKQWLRM